MFIWKKKYFIWYELLRLDGEFEQNGVIWYFGRDLAYVKMEYFGLTTPLLNLGIDFYNPFSIYMQVDMKNTLSTPFMWWDLVYNI